MFHLIWLGIGALGLQVENLHHAFPSKDMVVTAYPFIETKKEKQAPKIREGDAGVYLPPRSTGSRKRFRRLHRMELPRFR